MDIGNQIATVRVLLDGITLKGKPRSRGDILRIEGWIAMLTPHGQDSNAVSWIEIISLEQTNGKFANAY